MLLTMMASTEAWGQTRANVTDHMTASDLAATTTNYTNFSNVSLTSDAVYAGQSAKDGNGNIQLRSKNSNSGIISTTSGGTIKSITITVGSGTNTIDVYGSNTAYTSAGDLFNSSTQGTKLGSVSATGTITVTDDYEYVGVRSNNGAVYISSIDFVWSTGGTPTITHSLGFGINTEGAGTIVVGSNLTSPAIVDEGATLNISATANTGYVFNNWTVTTEGGSTIADATATSTTFTMGTADATLTANFSQVTTYTVTYIANGPSGYDNIVDTYNEGATATIRENTFNYAGHAFTKWSTEATGNSGTDYMPGETISNISTDYTLYARWEESNETIDVLTNANTIGGTTSTYTEWTATGTSGVTYSGQSAGSNGTIQLRSNNNNSGIVSTTSAGKITKVVVTWASGNTTGRSLDVYGKNTAYSSPSDLYSSETNTSGTRIDGIVYGTSMELTISGDYNYIGLRSASGAMYLDEIRITWVPDEDPAVATTVTIDGTNLTNTDVYVSTEAGSLSATVMAGSNPVPGAAITWTSNNTNAATIDENGVVTLVAAGSTTITANYAGETGTYKPSSATYNLTVTNSAPVALMTIAEVRAQGTGDVYTKGIITYLTNSNKNAYIQDATGAICVYASTNNYWTNNGYAVGDEITVSGNLGVYAGGGNILQIQNPTPDKLSSGNELPYMTKTIAEINTDNFADMQCLRVKIENATVQSVSGSNNIIAQDENTILVYSNNMGVTEGDIITSFYANVGYYNGVQLVNPTDVQVYQGPSLEADPTSLEFSYVAGGSAAVQTLTVSGDNLESDITITLSSSNFAISQDGINWDQTELTIQQATAIGEIQVRFNPGITAIGNYEGTITLSSTNATPVEVTLTGTVTGQTYTIEQYSTPATANGTITFSPESPIAAGTEVTLTAVPAAGYAFEADSWVFYKEDAGDYVIDNTITAENNQITMPAYNIWVDATFVVTTTVTDELTYSLIGVTGTNYTEWSGKTSNSTAVYAGKTAGGNNSIQLNATTTNGIISTTSGGLVRNITLTWNTNTTSGRKILVYGNNEAFSSISGMTSTTKLGEIEVGSTSLDITGDYQYVGLVGSGGACYIDKIQIVWEPSNDPYIIADDVNVAYNAPTGSIMYAIGNYIAGSMTATTTADWITDFSYQQVDEIGEVTFNLVENTTTSRTATVTLTYTYDDSKATTTKNVIVIQTGKPSISIEPIVLSSAGSSETIEVTYNNFTPFIADEPALFVDEDCTITFTGTWFTADFAKIATEDDYYHIEYLALENTETGPRTIYMKVEVLDENNQTVSTVVTVTQAAPTTTEINLIGTTDPLTFNAGDFTSSGSGYQSYTDITYTGSNNIEYGGWTLNNVMHASTNMQLRKNDGSVVMPTIKTDYGFTITVTAETNSVNVICGTDSGINTLTVGSTEASVTIAAGSVYAIISTITITPLTSAPAPVIHAEDIEIAYNATLGEIEYTISNPVSGKSLSAISTTTWISDINVDVNTITFTTTINDGDDDRIGTITLKYEGAEDVIVNVTQHHYVDDFATLPFEYTDDQVLDPGIDNMPTGLTHSDDMGTYPNSTPRLKFGATGCWLILKLNEAPVSVSYDIKGNNFSGGTFDVEVSTDGTNYESIATYTTLGAVQTITHILDNDNIRYIRWIYTNRSNGNVALGNIHATKHYDTYGDITFNNLDLTTSSESLIVHKGSVVTINGTLTNNEPDKILIKDGGQLILPTTSGKSGVKATVEKDITAAGSWGAAGGDANGWYTISSPLQTPQQCTGVNGLLTTGVGKDFDLYRYDESSHYWITYKENGNQSGFMIEPGRGYLYASENGTTIRFAGDINDAPITYDVTATDGAGVVKGFNLMGNPFTQSITLDNVSGVAKSTGAYVLTDAGNWSAVVNPTINPCQGFLVKVEESATATISRTATTKSRANDDYIALMVANGEYEDVAYAVFSDGLGLDKINHRNADIPMVYIPQDGTNYAIATMGDDTEMFNLNFKAMTTGQYTLRVNTKGSYSYIHVYDKMTKEDIDMLVEGEYSFIGSPRDAENRFIVRLSYSANIDELETSDIFAYQSGDDIIVDGNGELHVYDVMGRFVAKYNVNGIQTIEKPATTGVYIFRMVGNDVKTQKIVVR